MDEVDLSASMGPESGRLFPLSLEIFPYTMNIPRILLQTVIDATTPRKSLAEAV